MIISTLCVAGDISLKGVHRQDQHRPALSAKAPVSDHTGVRVRAHRICPLSHDAWWSSSADTPGKLHAHDEPKLTTNSQKVAVNEAGKCFSQHHITPRSKVLRSLRIPWILLLVKRGGGGVRKVLTPLQKFENRSLLFVITMSEPSSVRPCFVSGRYLGNN